MNHLQTINKSMDYQTILQKLYFTIEEMDMETFEKNIDEIDTWRLVLVAKCRGKYFDMEPDDENYRNELKDELVNHIV